MRLTAVVAMTALLGFAAPLAAQSVKIEFRDGKVDLSAQSATVRAILQEWGRQGGTKIVNGERIPGAPVTLELSGVYEREALEVLLRGVAGYMVGPRESSGAGASSFDRIMILPTSNAPRNAQAPTPNVVAPPRPPITNSSDDLDEDIDDGPPQLGPNTGRGVGSPRVPPPGFRPRVGQNAGQDGSQGNTPPGPTARERLQQIIEEDLEEEIETPAPSDPIGARNPFTAAPGSNRPGVIAPVPPAQPRQPPEQ